MNFGKHKKRTIFATLIALTILVVTLLSCRREVELGQFEMHDGVIQTDRPTPASQPSKSEPAPDDDELTIKVIPTFMPTPTRAVPDTTAVYYTVRVGDTMSRIAILYGTTVESIMRLNNLGNADQLQIGQQLQVSLDAQYTGPADHLIPDSEMVLGPGYASFDVETFVSSHSGFLNPYVETVLGVSMTGPDIVDMVSRQYSVGPRVLLALLELKGGWVTNPAPSYQQQLFPLDIVGPEYWQGLYHQLIMAADALNTGFYGWWYDTVWLLQTQDGAYTRYSEQLNAGTAGVQYLLAKSAANNADLVNTLNGFTDVYRQLFGNPFDYAVEPLTAPDTPGLDLTLPWSEGETWYMSGGPHPGWGTLGAFSALDFVTGERNIGCQISQGWVTAATNGLIVMSHDGMVLQDTDGDGDMGTGWVILYMHIASQDRVSVGSNLSIGDKIGHPSCEGGVSFASHLHLARRYNGLWIAVDDTRWPITLSGWTATPGSQAYEGTLSRDGVVKTACECWEDVNAIVH